MIDMPRIFTIAHMLIRVTGILLLILGLLIWAENMANLINIHMLLGLILVLSMWVFAAAAVSAGASMGAAIGVAVTGLIVLAVGMTQDPVFGGSVVIKIVHVLLGLAAISVAEAVAGNIRRNRVASA
jgi:hypothetical protein